MDSLKNRVARYMLKLDIARIRAEIEALARTRWQPPGPDAAARCRLAACRRHRSCQSDAIRRACVPDTGPVAATARRRQRPPAAPMPAKPMPAAPMPTEPMPAEPSAAHREPEPYEPEPPAPALYCPKDYAWACQPASLSG